MSRTHRRPLRAIEENEENYIKRQFGREYHLRWKAGAFYDYIKRRKPKEQYEAEYVEAYTKAYAEYELKLKNASYDENGRPYDGYVTSRCRWYNSYPTSCLAKNYINPPNVYVNRYYYETVQVTREERIEKYRKEYREFTRDGHWNKTGRNTGFKKAAAKATRIGNKRLERKIVKGDDYDHLPYPNEHDGDFLRWSFW